MRLTDLAPRWFAEPGRHGQGLLFRCPCGRCKQAERPLLLAVVVTPPLDGGTVLPVNKISAQWAALEHTFAGQDVDIYREVAPSGIAWQRTGDTFEALTLYPSINYAQCGHWHGTVQNGEVLP